LNHWLNKAWKNSCARKDVKASLTESDGEENLRVLREAKNANHLYIRLTALALNLAFWADNAEEIDYKMPSSSTSSVHRP